jgi:hypothetical protein
MPNAIHPGVWRWHTLLAGKRAKVPYPPTNEPTSPSITLTFGQCKPRAKIRTTLKISKNLKAGPDIHAGDFTKDWGLKFETFGPTFGCHNGFREAL